MRTGRAGLLAGLVTAVALAGCGTQSADSGGSATGDRPSDLMVSASSTSRTSSSTAPTSSTESSPSTSASTTSNPTPSTSAPTSTTPTPTTPTPAAATPTTPPPAPQPAPPPTKGDDPLRPGDDGATVLDLQQRLTNAGYWLGRADGTYGSLTVQAVMALQKSGGLSRDGVAGPKTLAALDAGTLPPLGEGPADRVEIDVARQVLIVVRGGQIAWVINTSTGSGETYISRGSPAVAVTPPGVFQVGRVYDGPEIAPLGRLYRPRYFNGGIAVHGAASIPAYPASHGCARVSDPAINLIWSAGLMPVGSTVIVR